MATNSGVTAIVEEFRNLEKLHMPRNNSYNEVLQFYSGKTLEETKKQGFISGIAENIASLFSPKAEDEGSQLKTPINLVKPAIENKVAFLALPPTIRVIEPPDEFAPQQTPDGGPGMPGNDPAAMGQIPTAVPGAAPDPTTGQVPMAPPGPAPTPTDGGAPIAPGPTNADWATDLADRLENVITTLLAQSNMPKRCRDVAWSVAAMDGAVIGAWPDIRHGRPRIFTRTPQDFYPVAYDADGLELQKAMWKEIMSGSEILARYGEAIGKKYKDRSEVDVIQYIDEEKFCTILDYVEFAHPPVENKMGIVPIACVGVLTLPGMVFGSTDIKDAIPVAKQINLHMMMIEEMSAALIRPTIAIKDPINVPEGIAIGRGGTITMGPQGNVELLGPLNLPNAFWQLSQQLQQWFDLISDNPNVLRSDDGGGLSTGAGFNAKLGPIAARQQQKLEVIMSAWRMAIKYMLIMWATFPGMKPVKSSGVKGKEPFYLKAEPNDFMVDGEIWTEIDVFLKAQSYLDRQGNAVEIMQLYQNELIDWDTAVDNLEQVTNKKRTRARIDKDRQWKAEGMATAQAAAQSAMTANVPLAAQEKTNYGLERGFMGETGAMPGPEGKAPEAGAAPMMGNPEQGMTPEGGEDLVAVLKDFFSGIPKLRGSVWFGGDPILAPEKIASDQWTVNVWVTDPLDKGTITRAAQNVEVIYGHIKFLNGAPSPDEQAIQVAGGGQEAPPEMEAPVSPEGDVSQLGTTPPEGNGDLASMIPPEMMGGV